ncbi:MAG: PD40 domain-containing protein [Verrucomicrobiaceae bacterium]|nr:PD40 domain-containing protein [Verrucomicrobiaceae bacterium]
MKIIFLLLLPALAFAEPVRLAHEPALSPDGKTVAFEWQGDLWTAPTDGGRAARLTTHPALDFGPAFSPDGKQIAFNSEREGFKLLYSMPVSGGEPKQLTFHTDGSDLREWTPDGKGLLVTLARDLSWLRESRSARHAIIDANERKAESVLFDDYGFDGVLSRDGQKLLFMREGSESWWRQGFKGSRAGQIWLFNRADGSFKQVISDENENRWPLWKPDGKGFYFVRNGNLWQHDLSSGKHTAITNFKDDLVVFPAISRDGKTLVFRVRFDLYRWHPGDKEPAKIAIEAVTDATPDITRVVLEKATDIHFTPDGLQMAFISGGDVWVMDTELKEPRRVTQTAEEERGVRFAPDSKSLVFVSEAGGQTDLWKAVPADEKKAWFESTDFTLTKLTNDPEADSSPRFTQDGKKLAWLRERGDLMLADADGKNAKRLIESWNEPAFEFSPDGTWLAYSKEDEWFNDDIWLMPVDGSKPAFNVSQHPDDDTWPHWSPDGKMLAWTGTREIDEQDVFYVHLLAEEDEKTKRERTLVKAREKIAKAKKPEPKKEEPKAEKPAEPAPKPEEPKKAEEPKKEEKKPEPLKIDFEGLHERVQRVKLPNSVEYSLVWSPDSKKLAFQSRLDEQKRTMSIEFPDELKPKMLSSAVLANAVWLKEGDQLAGLLDGKPATLSGKGGEAKTMSFKAQQAYSRAEKQRAVFDQCWQVMRDHFYDEKLGNRDWNAVRAKYRDMAAEAPDMKGAAECVWLMLGELNGSHLGFMIGSASSTSGWTEETAHLGLRFDASYAGPGWKVRDVIPKSPASRKESRVEAGEIILRVDGKDVQPAMDVSSVLNGPMERDIVLTVKNGDKTREVTLRPISYITARRLLYDDWIAENRKAVEKASGGTLGYLHISAMDDASFQKFQEELYHAGAGKDGLIIDVRENGGGSTTDHLLTALTQPRHAIAIPRGSKTPGYPQDRMIYATWPKPIVVLCNQNSYSNAEVFSHAIKTLKRGQLVGVRTAGGVISTGATGIMDVGTLRLPFRGWYVLSDGQDMELNGAKPDHIVWPKPGDKTDRQLEKAVEVLKADVEAWKKRPQPKLIKASERKP